MIDFGAKSSNFITRESVNPVECSLEDYDYKLNKTFKN